MDYSYLLQGASRSDIMKRDEVNFEYNILLVISFGNISWPYLE